MNSAVASSPMARPLRRARSAVHIDTVTIALVLSIALLGLVMVTSASVSIASKESGQTFFYLERQLLLMLIGWRWRGVRVLHSTQVLEKLSCACWSRRSSCCSSCSCRDWDIGERQPPLAANGRLNFQVSELARVLVLIYVASYAVRREEELRGTFMGLAKPLGLLALPARCCWSSRISARRPCCSQPASASCSSAGPACAM